MELKQQLAWFGDPELKERIVQKLKQHRAADQFVHGHYQTTLLLSDDLQDRYWKGCALGCMLPFGVVPEGSGNPDVWHRLVAVTFGLTEDVATVIDNCFEGQDNFALAGNFAVAVVEAIPVGADLSLLELCTEYVHDDECCHDMTSAQWAAEVIAALATAPVPEPSDG